MGCFAFDSIIFDMDGTLWDAVDSYCRIWNVTLTQFNAAETIVSRETLIGMMGKTIDEIVLSIAPQFNGDNVFISRLIENGRLMMPHLGGRLYEGVAETIRTLSENYKLFMVSNCLKQGLPDFLEFTKLSPYITDTLSNGDTGRGKADNIALIVRRHDLHTPLYVGDTRGDYDACRQAGVTFAWASYGFGKVDNPPFTLSKFSDILSIL